MRVIAGLPQLWRIVDHHESGCPTLRGVRLLRNSAAIRTGGTRRASAAKRRHKKARHVSAGKAKVGNQSRLSADGRGFVTASGFEAWTFLLPELGDFSHSHFRSPGLIHQHGSGVAISVVTIAAPRPLPRLGDQSSFHRIAMHVAQLNRRH